MCQEFDLSACDGGVLVSLEQELEPLQLALFDPEDGRSLENSILRSLVVLGLVPWMPPHVLVPDSHVVVSATHQMT